MTDFCWPILVTDKISQLYRLSDNGTSLRGDFREDKSAMTPLFGVVSVEPHHMRPPSATCSTNSLVQLLSKIAEG